MATTRIRKTFHYPDSSDDEDTIEAGLDAQDQAQVLTTLEARDATSTRLYTLLLLTFPSSIAFFTLPGLFGISKFLPSLLTLVSLAASAYTLYFLPLPPRSVGIFIDGKSVSREKRRGRAASGHGLSAATATASGKSVEVPWLSDEIQELLAQYIVPGNGALCGVLAVAELLQRREWAQGMMIGGGYLPGLVLAVILWARRELRVVDMSELQQLRS